MGIQVTISANQIDKERLGYSGISLTNLLDTSEPSVAAGSKIEVGGALYEFTIDETGTGFAGVAVSSLTYFYAVPAGASISWLYSATAPTWDTAKQGWYNGSNRAFAMLYKDAASLYQCKNLIPEGEAPLSFLGFVTSTVNPFLFYLPPSSGSGMRVRIVDYALLATGLILIHPSGTDVIGSAGNVDCYLQNVDQSGVVYKHQFLDLVDSASGTWTVVGGQFCPHQTVDTDGQQYHLGKLHHLPLGNTTNRVISTGTLAAASVWSAAKQVTGSFGIPTGAKGVKIKAQVSGTAAAAGNTIIIASLSNNNSSTPVSSSTAHPSLYAAIVAAGAGAIIGGAIVEIDVPLNSAGQFYIYTEQLTNISSTNCQLVAIGFYMGD